MYSVLALLSLYLLLPFPQRINPSRITVVHVASCLSLRIPSSLFFSSLQSFSMSVASFDRKKKAVKKAVKMKDPVTLLGCLPEEGRVSTSDGDKLTVRTAWATHLDDETSEWVFNLFERNMRLLYEKSQWGWDPEGKKNELEATTARYLLLVNESGENVAYCHYRIDMDYMQAVVYCYEIQVESGYQRKGLGSIIMVILEKLAAKLEMDKVMCTVFKYNVKSLSFFRKLGYTDDESHDTSGNDYVILSKAV